MARFTAGAPVNFEFHGVPYVGPAGTVFEVADSLAPALWSRREAIPGFAWVIEDEIEDLGSRVDALEAGGGGGGEHPNLAAHDTMGLSTQAELDAHGSALDPHPNYALDADLVDHETDGHPHNHDSAYEAAGAVSTHAVAVDPHTGYLQESAHTAAVHASMAELASQAELDAHAALTTHHARLHSITSGSDHSFPGGTSTFLRADGSFAAPPGGGGEAFPVGSVFISVVSTNPATLLGYGTWAAFGAGRTLVGLDAGQTEFDAVEETGGAKTHTLTAAEMPAHVHDEYLNSATTGGLIGQGARDTSTNTASLLDYDTGSAGGGGAHNNLQPYIVVYMWKRTA
jgi:hypothetical protein